MELVQEAYPVHLEIETGMHRLGFEERDLEQLLDLLKQNHTLLKIQSVFSHLAASDNEELDWYTKAQIEQFERFSKKIEDGIGYSFLRHINNTAGILRFPEAQFDMVRLGIGLYGIDSSAKHKYALRNVSTLKTIISQIKYLKAGESVGYDRRAVTTRDTVIATVGIGYADGLNRSLSNGVGQMIVRGKRVPIIGNICMDMCMLDVTEVPDVEEGDEVLVFGEGLSPAELAGMAKTIPYEIISGISQRVKRVYFRE
jgi:alanine racemase